MFWFSGHEACGMESTPPALEGEVITTGPPGKSLKTLFCRWGLEALREGAEWGWIQVLFSWPASFIGHHHCRLLGKSNWASTLIFLREISCVQRSSEQSLGYYPYSYFIKRWHQMWMSYLKEQDAKSEGRMLLRENAPETQSWRHLDGVSLHSTYTQSRMIFAPKENNGHWKSKTRQLKLSYSMKD